jgi:hypothetical protein
MGDVVVAFLLSLIPFGIHATRGFLSVVSMYFVETSEFTFAGVGIALSIEFLPSILLPIALGRIVTSLDATIFAIKCCLAATTISSLMIWFVVSKSSKYEFFMFSIFLFGCSSCCITPLQRVLIIYKFKVICFIMKNCFVSL